MTNSLSLAMALAVCLGIVSAVSGCTFEPREEVDTSSNPVTMEMFYGTWKGIWKRYDKTDSGEATVKVSVAFSNMVEAVFTLPDGRTFTRLPPFYKGELGINNHYDIVSKWELLPDGSLSIVYDVYGESGEYWLTKVEEQPVPEG